MHALIKDLLEHMMSSIEFNKIISFITKNFEKIPFKHLKENICQILSQHTYQKVIFKQAINLLTSDIRGMTKNLYYYRNKGVTSQERCGACKNLMSSETFYKEKFIVFICGHGYHAKCVKDNLCLVCIRDDEKKGDFVFNTTYKRKKQ